MRLNTIYVYNQIVVMSPNVANAGSGKCALKCAKQISRETYAVIMSDKNRNSLQSHKQYGHTFPMPDDMIYVIKFRR